MRFLHLMAGALILAATSSMANAAEQRPLVLELYTSQGCSSCPVADALLKALADEPSVLALSFHVHYWDYLGWTDPFASVDNTNRQRNYAKLISTHVFTPQMVVDGDVSMVGSDARAIQAAMQHERDNIPTVPITLSADTKNKILHIRIASVKNATGKTLPETATVWAMRYQKYAKTAIKAGENSGRTVENINSVTHTTQLGTWNQSQQHFQLPIGDLDDNGVAILIQTETQGRIIGAANYANTKRVKPRT